MSIYEPRSKRAPGAGTQPARPRQELTLEGVSPPVPQAPPVQNLARLRKATPVEYLLPASLAWFQSLPAEVRPVALATKYARIVNLLAQQWNDESACSAYFEELLKGRRSNRRGFPVDVRRELWLLREFYQRTRLNAGGGLAVV